MTTTEDTTTIRIDSDEWYPAYFVIEQGERSRGQTTVTVPKKTAARWRKAYRDYEKACNEMADAEKKAQKEQKS